MAFMGLCSAVATGFAVQVAHLIGAKKKYRRSGCGPTGIHGDIPLQSFSSRQQASPYHHFFRETLGGAGEVATGASEYFLIFALSLPAMQLNFPSNNMLRCSGNMLVPGITGVLMCLLDIIFNFSLYFPRNHTFRATNQYPGFDMGVRGAALGTGLAMLVHRDFPRGISVAWQFGTQPA